MKYRPLGASGLIVSDIGLGTNGFGERVGPEESVRVVHAALDAGITFIDTANFYGDGAAE